MLAIFEGRYHTLNVSEAYAFVHRQKFDYTQIIHLSDVTYKLLGVIKNSVIIFDDVCFGRNKRLRLARVLREDEERNLLFVVLTKRVDLVDKRLRAHCDVRAKVMEGQSRYLIYGNVIGNTMRRDTKFYGKLRRAVKKVTTRPFTR